MKYSIYKLVCSETNKIYVGSTSLPLRKRLWGHNSKSNFSCSKELIKPKMHLIEEIETDDLNTVLNREKDIIKILPPSTLLVLTSLSLQTIFFC